MRLGDATGALDWRDALARRVDGARGGFGGHVLLQLQDFLGEAGDLIVFLVE